MRDATYVCACREAYRLGSRRETACPRCGEPVVDGLADPQRRALNLLRLRDDWIPLRDLKRGLDSRVIGRSLDVLERRNLAERRNRPLEETEWRAR